MLVKRRTKVMQRPGAQSNEGPAARARQHLVTPREEQGIRGGAHPG